MSESFTKKIKKSSKNDKGNDSDKKIKIKKNIEILKKESKPIIKVKSNINETGLVKKSIGKSMDDAFKANEVMLWGLNSVDSIILELYEKDFVNKIKKSKKDEGLNEKINSNNNNTLNENGDNDEQKYFEPFRTYEFKDMDFLNKEYERVDEKLIQAKDEEQIENLLDLQEKIANVINELNYENEQNNLIQSSGLVKEEQNIIAKSESNLKQELEESKESNTDLNEKNISKNQTSIEIDKSSSKKKYKRTTKIKPYYYIGNIPEGYRAATQEEAIINKKVSWFGKYKVNRELYNLYCVCGAIYVDEPNIKQLNLKILALKGKLRFYKKEYEYWKISYGSNKITDEKKNEIKEKINDIKDCYKKTFDVLNLHIESYKKQLSKEENTVNKSNKIQIEYDLDKSDKSDKSYDLENIR